MKFQIIISTSFPQYLNKYIYHFYNVLFLELNIQEISNHYFHNISTIFK